MPKLRRNTTIIIGEGPTEFYYLNSLKDEFRILQNIKPDTPKNTSLRELERSIESAIAIGYDRIFCLIDMDTKKKDATSRMEYARLKSKYHGKKVTNEKKGLNYEVRFLKPTGVLSFSFSTILDIPGRFMSTPKLLKKS